MPIYAHQQKGPECEEMLVGGDNGPSLEGHQLLTCCIGSDVALRPQKRLGSLSAMLQEGEQIFMDN